MSTLTASNTSQSSNVFVPVQIGNNIVYCQQLTQDQWINDVDWGSSEESDEYNTQSDEDNTQSNTLTLEEESINQNGCMSENQ